MAVTNDFLDQPVAQIFLQARYRDVVEATYEQSDWSHEDPTNAIAIAALAFVGRLDEAKSVLRLALKSKHLDADQRIFAEFYLATSLTRHGHYTEARKLLSEIFWLQRKQTDQKFSYRSAFFIAQGLAFFRFVGGRYTDADKHAKNAIELAILAKFPYGRVLALDLQGHCLHQLGFHHESLQILEDAMRLAQKLGLSSLADNIALQRDLFVSRFTLDLSASRKRLEELTQQVRFQNSYSQSILILELSRIALIQGRVTHAKSLLNESPHFNLVRGDRRLRAQQDLKLALAADMSGDQDQAIKLLVSVLSNLDPHMDFILGLQATGLLAQMHVTDEKIKEYGQGKLAFCPQQNAQITHRSGRYLAKKILARKNSNHLSGLVSAHLEANDRQDSLGKILDVVAKKDVSAFRQLCVTGNPGLAVRAFEFPKQFKKFIAIFETSHDFLVGDQGDVHYIASTLTELMIDVLTTIAAGDGSMEALATRVWQAREYHPLKHDSKIYRVLSKLRHMLGNNDSWIKTTSSGYHIPEDVTILLICNNGILKTLSTEYKPDSRSMAHPLSLSDRIVDHIKVVGRTTNRDIVAKFQISPVTCARTLAKMVNDKQLKRMGAGRSTTYICR